MSIAYVLRIAAVALALAAAGPGSVRAQPDDSPPAPARAASPELSDEEAAHGNVPPEDTHAELPPGSSGRIETVLQSRNKAELELAGKPVSLTIAIEALSSGRELNGNVSFKLVADEALEPTDNLTCSPSHALTCGVVLKFSAARKKPVPTTVLEATIEEGVFMIEDSRDFETFIDGVINNDRLAVKLRVDQKRDFIFDLRQVAWPLADFGADHPFAKRFAGDPVLAALKKRYPARYLKIMTLVRKEVPDTGTLDPDAETKILDALHGTIGTLRPMVSDELLERIVANANAAAREIGSRDLALCNALAVAARSAVTTPELKDTQVARDEYELWQQVVEQANPRYIRKVPNEDLLPSTDRFENNVRIANQSGCGMFAAVIEAILKLPRHERRLWLRATVGTVEDLRADTDTPRRQ